MKFGSSSIKSIDCGPQSVHNNAIHHQRTCILWTRTTTESFYIHMCMLDSGQKTEEIGCKQ